MVELVLASFVGLFLEMAAIRWLNSNVHVVGMFTNLVVVASFLGLGLGCLAARRRDLSGSAGALVLALVLAPRIGDWLGLDLPLVDDIVWAAVDRQPSANTGSVPWIAAVFALVAAVFVPIGQLLARQFGRVRAAGGSTLLAYGLDVGGSLIGVLAFAAASALGAPPPVWFSSVAVPIVVLAASRRARAANALALGAAIVLAGSGREDERWSPYYCITTRDISVQEASGRTFGIGFMIGADGSRLQDALSFGPALDASPLAPWRPYYRIPYHFARPRSVLVLGAGAGNEVVAALDAGAERVVAVEIDPVIAEMGRTRHPHRPYADRRVEVVVDDARAYLARSAERFDVVVISALDSARQLAGMANLRLESFVYTVDSFRAVRARLAPKGVFVLNMISARPWVGARIHASLEAAFGAPPRTFTTPQSPFVSVAFVSGGPPGLVDLAPDRDGLSERRALAPPGVVLATDDWPHLYLAERAVPRTYIVLMSVMVLGAALAIRLATPRASRGRFDVHLFLLGAGFMLLETRSITALALIVGSTWSVNAVVIASILGVILLANALVAKGRLRHRGLAYLLLAGALVVSWSTSIQSVLALEFGARVAAAALLVGAPVFCAALIFSRSFADAEDVEAALGSNLLGAVLGGALEYTSTGFGLASLHLVALAVYAASGAVLLARRRR